MVRSQNKIDLLKEDRMPEPERLYVIADPGNSDIKMMELGSIGREVVFPHAVRQQSSAEYKVGAKRFLNQPSYFRNTSIFQKDGVNYIVGDEALRKGRPTRITGPDKYKRGHIDVLIAAGLLKIAPDGHNNVGIAIAHPPNATAYIDDIINSMKGTHEITRWDGQQIKYKIKSIVTWDEPVGGLIRFMTRDYAEYNEHDIRPDHRLLIIDIGGKVSSMVPVVVGNDQNYQVLYSDSAAFNLGIQDIESTLAEELRDLHSDLFKVRDIPRSILHEALRRKGTVTVKNVEYDVKQAVLNATAELLNYIENAYINDMDKGLDIHHIVVTGGGGGLMFEMLRDEVLEHNFVYLADDLNTIQLANLRGGAKAYSIILANRKKSHV